MAHNNKNIFFTLNKRVAVIGFALREAFIALVPFFILTSISTLILEALLQFQIFENISPVKVGVKLLKSTLPLMVLISFSYQLAKLKAIDSTASVVLALALLFTLQPFDSTMLYNTNSSFLALLIPIFSTFFWHALPIVNGFYPLNTLL